MEFKEQIILIYFHSVKDEFLYSDLIELLGINYEILDDMLQKLIDENYLTYDEYHLIVISDSGLEFLVSNKLENLKLFDLLEKHNNLQFSSYVLPINGLYIPKKFDQKFTSY